MPEKLVYPFKHHTKLKDRFFTDLKFYRGEPLTENESAELQARLSEGPNTWESKSLFNDIYADFCLGLLRFMEEESPLLGLLYKNASPKAVARLEKIMGSDEAVCCFLPAYRELLNTDFLVLMASPDFSRETTGNPGDAYSEYRQRCNITLSVVNYKDGLAACKACGIYDNVIYALSCRFLYDYAGVYGKDPDEMLAAYIKQWHKYDNVLKNVAFMVDDMYIATLESGCRGYMRSFVISLLELVAETYEEVEDHLISTLMEKFSAADDKEIKFFLNLNVVTFFSRQFPDICKMMRHYYAKVQEIKVVMDDN